MRRPRWLTVLFGILARAASRSNSSKLPCHRPKLQKWGAAKLKRVQPSCYHWLQRNARRSYKSRRRQFEASATETVQRALEEFAAFPPQMYSNATALAELVCRLGLNDEVLHQFPAELVPYYGTGLHIMQYPVQFGQYLALLAASPTPVRGYVEIGARWGGTFIAVAEVIRRTQGSLEFVAAVDPMGESPLLTAYAKRLRLLAPRVAYSFFREYSTSETFAASMRRLSPTLVFIDGDHSYKTALSDHRLAESAGAKLIAHHDIVSDCCQSRRVWEEIRKSATPGVPQRFVEFVEQYNGVKGRWLGIGVVVR